MPRPEPFITGFTHTIDGRAETSARTFDVIDPATEEPLAQCPDASPEQLDLAVGAARRAFQAWSALPFDKRREYLIRFARAIHERIDHLAPLLTRETGKPLAAARAEIAYAPIQVEKLTSITIASETLRDDAGGWIELRYRPLGIVGIITPWNVPAAIAMGRIVQALYTGNTVIEKPSPYAPLTLLRIGEIARDTLPAGALNVVAGGSELGSAMATHPGIDKIAFTGSVPTGKKVFAAGASNLKRVTLELGGNDAAIVLDDIDVGAATPKLFWAAFANCGQICVAIKRLYVHDSVYEPICEKLAEMARTVKVGNGLDPGVEIGPVQNRMQYERVLGILEDTRQRGARILAGGHALDGPGYFVAPTIVSDIAEGTRLVDEEPFGPILPVLRYSDVDDAIRRANHTRYGLGGSVWTTNLARGAEIAARLEVGTAWVNQHVTPEPSIPFGGAKESGFGREYSALGLKSYMEAQVISVARG
ncbi:MAG TPA: aldehyde dehydrogenase family protein [Terriglobia bacterium]|nr:aldehyde dehydrogenase family protein [Terriglobia bacterium]